MPDSDLPASSSPAPAAIGRYRVLSRLDFDAVGETFHAFDPMIERPVVIRVFHWPGCRPDEAQAMTLRFFEEVRRVGLLVHPGIVPLFDAGDCPSGLFMATEYLDGHHLAEVLGLPGPRDAARALAVLMQVAEAIDYAHSQGVTHQDLRPSRVRLTPDGTVRVGGFGVAAAVQALRGVLAQSSSIYRAPECLEGCADHRADIYSVGALAVALLTSHDDAARRDASPAGTQAPWHPGILEPALPHAVAACGVTIAQWRDFAARALAADPAARFATAQEAIQHLAWLTGVEVSVSMPMWDLASGLDIVSGVQTVGPDSSSSSITAPAFRSTAAGSEAETMAANGSVGQGPDDDLTITKL